MRSRWWFALSAVAILSAWGVGALLAADTLSTSEMIMRASELKGMNVYNRDDNSTKLGDLGDLIIDAHTGEVMYGVLDTGITGKNIPVPWVAFKIHKNTASGKYSLSLNKTGDELKEAPSLARGKAPDYTNTQWRESVNKFFGVRVAARPRPAGDLSANELTYRCSQLMKLKVYNQAQADVKLGALDDLILDAHSGKVMYGVLDTGIGGKHIAVPWTVTKLHQKGDDSWLTVNKSSDDLKSAPAFDTKNPPDYTNDQWKKSIDDFFRTGQTGS